MPGKYVITQEQRMYFSSVLLLDFIINGGKIFPVLLEDDAKMLESTLVYMASKGWLNVAAEGYIPTQDGRKVLENHKQKLTEFRAIYKIYSAVDLGEGEFAYDKYFDFETDEEFIRFIHEDRFEDIRVAICEFKKINPLEVIFLEMVDEGRFDYNKKTWEADLATGLIWDEMAEIANTNIHVEDFAEYDDNNNLLSSGEEIIQMILKQGADLSKFLLEEQAKSDAQQDEEEFDEDEEITTTTTTTEYVDYVDDPYYDAYYYEPYYDPFFVSACWLACWY